MNQMSFGTPEELAKYVNDNTIAQAKIVEIFWKEGRWFLFWYT